jgi:hypothetical protein
MKATRGTKHDTKFEQKKLEDENLQQEQNLTTLSEVEVTDIEQKKIVQFEKKLIKWKMTAKPNEYLLSL